MQIDGYTIDDSFANEIGTLEMLKDGLFGIASTIRKRESMAAAALGGLRFDVFGVDFDGTRTHLSKIACAFHWFGVSVCNYARLSGYLVEMSKGKLQRSMLTDRASFKSVREVISAYVSSIPELRDVTVWRNKVAAHFAITDPYTTDNIATLEMSVMFPVTFSRNRYRVGTFTLTKSSGNVTHTSQLPEWSVTEVYDSLLDRFWPELKEDWRQL